MMANIDLLTYLLTCICKNSKYLKSIASDSVIACDEIISVMDIVSTKMTNTIATTNVTRNCHSKKVRHCYIFYTVLVAIILLLIIATIMQKIDRNKKALMY